MTALVLDASAAVELISRTAAGASVSRHITNDEVLWVPDGVFDVELNRRGGLRPAWALTHRATGVTNRIDELFAEGFGRD